MKAFNIKIKDKTFRISIRKFIEVVLIRDQSDNIYFNLPHKSFFLSFTL